MYSLTALWDNFPLKMAVLAWGIAQVTKLILVFFLNRDAFSLNILYSSGGMPSSHSATVCALAVSVLLQEGFASTSFAICAVLSFIVMYDARGVRRSAGEQAQTLNQIAKHLADSADFPIDYAVKEILGHTPSQVIVGATLGIVVPLIARFGFGIY